MHPVVPDVTEPSCAHVHTNTKNKFNLSSETNGLFGRCWQGTWQFLFIAPARSAGASYSRPGFLNDLVWIVPQWRGILRRRRKIHEYIWGYFKFHEIPPNHRLRKRDHISEDSSNRRSTGFIHYRYVAASSRGRFSGISENPCFFWISEDWTVFRFPIFGPFLATFFRKFLHWAVLEWVKFCAEGANFTKVREGTSKFQKKFKTPNGKLYRWFSEIHRIEQAPASMLAGIGLSRGRFSGISENPCFFLN